VEGVEPLDDPGVRGVTTFDLIKKMQAKHEQQGLDVISDPNTYLTYLVKRLANGKKMISREEITVIINSKTLEDFKACCFSLSGNDIGMHGVPMEKHDLEPSTKDSRYRLQAYIPVEIAQPESGA